MAQVNSSAGDKVVDRENFPPSIEEAVAKVRSEKSRASRDYSTQWVSLFLPMFSG
jgi:hypothetical protein